MIDSFPPSVPSPSAISNFVRPPSSSDAKRAIDTTALHGPTTNETPSTPRLQSARSSLEQLPLELRQQTYAYLFSDNDHELLNVTVRLIYNGSFPRLQSPAFPTFRSLLLTGQQISAEARDYFFRYHRFRLVDVEQSPLSLILNFNKQIGPTNLALIRKIAVPLFSIGLFGNVDCLVGLSKLRCASSGLTLFPNLAYLDLGINLIECLPYTHGFFDIQTSSTDVLAQWDWSEEGSGFPLRECFEKLNRFMGMGNVDVGIYWSDLLTQELLPDHNREVFATFETNYKDKFLVVLQQWLRAKSVKSRGPLTGFGRAHHFGSVVIPNDRI